MSTLPHRILVIEENVPPRGAGVAHLLSPGGDFACERVSWQCQLGEIVGRSAADAIVAVASADRTRAMRFFESLLCRPIAKPTVAILPDDAAEPLLGAAAAATDDFILSPFGGMELRHRLHRMLGSPRADVELVQRRLAQEVGLVQLVGRAPEFARVIEQIPRIAASDMAVVVTGETGTGKELCARAIHHLGPRRNAPFIAVDCSAIPDALMENELFGHVRGAYTDAHSTQRGLVAMAEGGTIFLDEVDSLSLVSQAKLLRFLQERVIRPLGADRSARVHVNVLAATNRDLEAAVRANQFRSDLFYRLSVLRLHLPPLRARRSDIALLAEHFLAQSTAQRGGGPKSFSAAALRVLAMHPWPGNVRELHNTVQRALVACEGSQILPRHLAFLSAAAVADEPGETFRSARAAALAAFERAYVEGLLRRHRGNVSRAAREAQKERRAFGRLLKKHQIDRHAFQTT